MLVTLLTIVFVFVSLLMVLVILIQKPRGGGLSGAFGGSGGAVQQAFGSKVGDLLTWFTTGCFIAFLLLSMGLTWAIRPAQEDLDAPTIQPATTDQAPLPGDAPPPIPSEELPATQP
ncbi:MAG: preprotein translocase subunit SecG [Phycisphaeraceae bacterium]